MRASHQMKALYSELFWDGDRDHVRMKYLGSRRGKMCQILLEILE